MLLCSSGIALTVALRTSFGCVCACCELVGVVELIFQRRQRLQESWARRVCAAVGLCCLWDYDSV